jgi:hypothetical protein
MIFRGFPGTERAKVSPATGFGIFFAGVQAELTSF